MTTVKELLTKTPVGSEVAVKGWVRTFRSRRFISLNDGSTPANIQGVVDFESFDEDRIIFRSDIREFYRRMRRDRFID